MTLRLALAALVASVAFAVALPSQAHPEEPYPAVPEVEATAPTTCAELANRTPQAGDANNPELKALKAQCDAEKAAKAGKPTTPPPTNKKD